MPAWLLIPIAVLLGVSYFLWRRSRQHSHKNDRQPAEPQVERQATSPPATAAKADHKPATGGTATTTIELPTLSLPTANADEEEDDPEVEPTQVGIATPFIQPPTKIIVADASAEAAEPETSDSYFLVSASAQTDRGLRRKRNEDSVLALPDMGVFIVADGMGGYAGGEVASRLAVETMEAAFRSGQFEGELHANAPPAASELARAIQMANAAIFDKARSQPALTGMGTTVCACRFSASRRRLYVGHVGDSRLYRLREGVLKQVTSDHNLKEFGAAGRTAAQLSRAVGIWPTVTIDIILAEPQPGDTYLICSDGLTKMLPDPEILKAIDEAKEPAAIVERLIADANAKGGMDNITVILITIESPSA